MTASGGNAQRVTFNGTYNISPRISPDGKSLAYISRRDGRFQLYVLDLASGQELRLSDTTKDESPSFSPNGKYIMYATESGGRRGTLAVVSVDGRIKQRVDNPGRRHPGAQLGSLHEIIRLPKQENYPCVSHKPLQSC